MPRCQSCRQENPEGFRLCGMCGAALPLEREPVEHREVRKVVTVELARLGATLVAEEDVVTRVGSLFEEGKRLASAKPGM